MRGLRAILPRTPGRMAVAIAGVCVAIYHVNGRPHAEVDCVAAPYTAWSLVQDGSLDVARYPDLDNLVGTAHLIDLSDGRRVSMRSPGGALAVAPFVAPLAMLRADPPRSTVMLYLGKVAGSVCTAVAAGLLFFTLRRLAPGGQWSTTVLFAFGTCVWTVASQALWTHGPATMWVMLGISLLVRTCEGRESPWLYVMAGVAFGLAYWTRSSTVLLGFAAGVALLCRRDWRGAGAYLVGVLPFLAGLTWLNQHLFGAAVLGGYANDGGFSTPLSVGFLGLLIAPSRGLFVYTPALLLAPVGLWLICREPRWRELRPLICALFVAAIATAMLYGSWYDWPGGWCYGPRFLIETLPVWCLLFAVVMDQFPSGMVRRSGWLLVSLSVAVQLVGIAGHSEYGRWNLRHNSNADNGRGLFSPRDTQIGAHWQGTVDKLRTLVGSAPEDVAASETRVTPR